MKPTPAPLSREAFLALLRDSGALGGDELREAMASAGSGDALARRLVQSGLLTDYQVRALLEGRAADLRLGNYDVLDLLGQGGMGAVFKARHRRMKRVVALKVLSREVAGRPEFVQRFQREVETIARLSHPNIVMAYDADEAECGHFLVMEFVDGPDLASEVMLGPLSVADAVGCVTQAAAGLAYAHSRGIVHRDVKPANLLRDAAGVVKVADLGLARLSGPAGQDASLTQAGGSVGTTDFMPPEQALDSTTVDQRADVYGLGCTLYFLLSGRPPYAGSSLMAILLKHRESPIPSLREQRPDVPEALDAVFARAVAKRPEDRYPSMGELIAALDAVRGAGPLPDVPPVPPASSEVYLAPASALALSTLLPAPATTSAATRIPEAMPTPSEAGHVAGLAVVLVEPSRAQAGIIRRYLRELGVEQVHAVGSGRDALEAAKAGRADVLVSALHLSDMTGVALAQALRAGSPEIGFVLTTSEADSAGAAAMLGAAARAVLLPKPFDLRTLARALASAAGRTANETA